MEPSRTNRPEEGEYLGKIASLAGMKSIPADVPRLDPANSCDLAADLDLAQELADIADSLSLSRFRAVDLKVDTKPDRSPVTEADLAVERAIRDRLSVVRPADVIFGEEFGGTEDQARARSAARTWIIDPIDGTANFLRGVPVWGTLIALAMDGNPVVGVASAPALGRRWWAARGHGAWTNVMNGVGGTHGMDREARSQDANDIADAASPASPFVTTAARRISVSGVTELTDASLSFQSLAQWRDAGQLATILNLAARVWRDRAYGDLWPYTLLAEGLLDITTEYGIHPYDIAALIPIVEEAGGRFTSVTGEPGPWHGSALATNGMLHGEVLRALAS